MNQSSIPATAEPIELADSSERESGHEYCSNCGAKLAGLYCHSCGQSSKSMIKFFGEVAKELLDDTIGYDSRIKHSIAPLLFKPGRITLDYIKGKRFFYVLPFRLYLITSLILILLIKGVTNTDKLKFDNIVAENSTAEVSEVLKQEHENKAATEINEALKEIQEELGQMDADGELVTFSSEQASEAETDEIVTKSTSQVEQQIEETQQDIDSQKPEPSENTNEDGSSFNLNWDSESQQLVGFESMEDSWFKSFLTVVNPKIKKWKKDPRPLVDSFYEALPYMMFIILPLFALFLKLFYAFSARYYIEHLVFLLHNHAFIYMVLMIEIVSDFTAEKLLAIENPVAKISATTLDWFSTLLAYWMVIYVFLAMKRFYRQGWGATIAKTLVLGVIYFVMIFFGFMLTLAIGAYQA